ncbi:urease accessory protein UreD [Thiohalophilus sp.]|uniref:urease accessory protein UreD n=1 Tax=Thiohalophilus sp. TaxID=3028392 RepID=UPI0039766658
MNAVAEQAGSWFARLELDFSYHSPRTVISRRKHTGPLVIQKPFYPEGPVCHTYLLHPPGGVVGGDRLQLDVNVAPNAHALITTPAAGKFYRSDGRIASMRQRMQVQGGAILEWLPQETILFSASQGNLQTVVELEPGAGFIGWEITCLGRPASDEKYDQGELRQHFELWREGRPLLIERNALQGNAPILDAVWGLQGYPVSGTLLAVNADKPMLDAVREALQDHDEVRASATLINDVLVCRGLAQQAESLRNLFIQLWEVIRPALLLRTASSPRIWFT